jgi:hypothetical protein
MSNGANDRDAGDGQDGGGQAAAATMWTFLSVLVALLALIGLVVYAGENYKTVQDATTLLGVVVPAVVSVGAAAAGIRIAYDRGQNTGEKQKEAELKSKLQPLAEEAQGKTSEALEPVVQTLGSPQGTEDLVLAPGESLPAGQELRVPGESITEAKEALAELRGAVNALG